MMKMLPLVVVVAATAISSAAAFAPSSSGKASTSVVTTALHAEEPWGGAPLIGGKSLVLGQPEWKRLTQDIGTADTGVFLRAAEIKHGRSAMIATVGYAFEKFGLTFDKISPHEYLSVTKNIKFADLAAMKPIDAVKAIPGEGWAQIFVVIAAIEIYELTHRSGEIKYGETVAPGLQPGGLTGDIGWNPLQIKIDDRRRLVEIQNGRAAMFAITAWVCAEAIPGSVPIPLLW